MSAEESNSESLEIAPLSVLCAQVLGWNDEILETNSEEGKIADVPSIREAFETSRDLRWIDVETIVALPTQTTGNWQHVSYPNTQPTRRHVVYPKGLPRSGWKSHFSCELCYATQKLGVYKFSRKRVLRVSMRCPHHYYEPEVVEEIFLLRDFKRIQRHCYDCKYPYRLRLHSSCYNMSLI